MCDFLINSIIVFVASCGSLIATIIMLVCKVRIHITYFIGMFMVSSLFFCASLTWIVIACFVRERPSQVVVPVTTAHVPPPLKQSTIKQYTAVTVDANIVLGKCETQLVVVTQP